MKARLTTLVVTLWLVLLSVNGIAAPGPASQGGVSIQTALGTNFVYQGFLTTNGQPATGSFNFEFRIYDAPTAGNQVGNSSSAADLAVSNGLFTTMIDAGPNVFNGQARFLEIRVQPASGGQIVTLSPRVELAGVPYAQYAQSSSVSSTTSRLQGRPVSSAAPALNQILQWDGNQWIPTDAAATTYTAGNGLVLNGNEFSVAVPLNLSGSPGAPVISGVSGDTEGIGVLGRADANNGTGILGSANSGPVAFAMWGINDNGATYWWPNSPTGVVGSTGTGIGVAGISDTSTGVYGSTHGSGTYAGLFNGKVRVVGDLEATGAKPFVIDHPLDPANKNLYHVAVESPDMKNFYDGVITLDSNGQAVVDLPKWFEALNQDFRYQLTCIGGFASVYIAQEIKNNRFTIAGGKPGMKISWQVTGIRHDPYAEQHRVQVEVDKPAQERGKYLYPQGYGAPETQGVTYALDQNEQTKPRLPVR